MVKSRFPCRWVVIAAATAAVVITGCGSDPVPEASPPSTSESRPSTTATTAIVASTTMPRPSTTATVRSPQAAFLAELGADSGPPATQEYLIKSAEATCTSIRKKVDLNGGLLPEEEMFQAIADSLTATVNFAIESNASKYPDRSTAYSAFSNIAATGIRNLCPEYVRAAEIAFPGK